MRKPLLWASALLAIGLAACEDADPIVEDMPSQEVWIPEAPEADRARVVSGMNAFAVDLYGRLASADGSFFFSPASLSTALTMTRAGARGQTASEMDAVLHLPDLADVHAASQAVTGTLATRETGRGGEISIANALWGAKDAVFRSEYVELLGSRYGAALSRLDFEKAPAAATRTINEWVEKRTRGKIRDLIPEGKLDERTRLVLTNAIYFKADWKEPFEQAMTTTEPFWIAADRSVDAPLMRRVDSFRLFENDAVQVLELPYEGRALSMVVVLPRARDGLSLLEASLSTERLREWLSGLARRKVDVALPRFRLESQFSLSQVLIGLGMSSAFSDSEADFSGMSETEQLRIDEVLHKAFVAVDEKGTEAAASTAIEAVPTAARPDRPVVFRADHPFLFAIRDRSTGALLFLGRLADPWNGRAATRGEG